MFLSPPIMIKAGFAALEFLRSTLSSHPVQFVIGSYTSCNFTFPSSPAYRVHGTSKNLSYYEITGKTWPISKYKKYQPMLSWCDYRHLGVFLLENYMAPDSFPHITTPLPCKITEILSSYLHVCVFFQTARTMQ